MISTFLALKNFALLVEIDPCQISVGEIRGKLGEFSRRLICEIDVSVLVVRVAQLPFDGSQLDCLHGHALVV